MITYVAYLYVIRFPILTKQWLDSYILYVYKFICRKKEYQDKKEGYLKESREKAEIEIEPE